MENLAISMAAAAFLVMLNAVISNIVI